MQRNPAAGRFGPEGLESRDALAQDHRQLTHYIELTAHAGLLIGVQLAKQGIAQNELVQPGDSDVQLLLFIQHALLVGRQRTGIGFAAIDAVLEHRLGLAEVQQVRAHGGSCQHVASG